VEVAELAWASVAEVVVTAATMMTMVVVSATTRDAVGEMPFCLCKALRRS